MRFLISIFVQRTVSVAIGLLKDRFGNDLVAIPRSLRFIAYTKFRYGVRSVAHLIDIIDKEALEGNTLNGAKFGFPTDAEAKLEESSLSLRLFYWTRIKPSELSVGGKSSQRTEL
jgi:hypothetical protein